MRSRNFLNSPTCLDALRVGKALLASCLLSLVLVGQSLIDILIVYPEETETYLGGPDGVHAESIHLVEGTNLAFLDSKIDARLILKGVEKIEYSESPTDMSVDLDYITDDPGVAALRDQVGADLVCFLRRNNTEEFGGKAWILDDPSGKSQSGFSVVSVESATGGLLFQHEIGHNLGGAHDRDNSVNGGLFPYSHGYRFTAPYDVQFRTIMAYAPGNLINYFSNPSILS